MHMSEKGNFIVYTNRNKQPGDQRPLFQGRLAAPGEEKHFAVALWGGKDKNGNLMFTGRSSAYASNSEAMAQVEDLLAADAPAEGVLEEAGLKIAPHQIVLFKNAFKDAEHPDRPDFWGRWNPGAGLPLVAVSGWMRKDRYQRPMLAGEVTLPKPGVEVGKAEASEQTLNDLIEAGVVTTADQAKPKRAAARGR